MSDVYHEIRKGNVRVSLTLLNWMLLSTNVPPMLVVAKPCNIVEGDVGTAGVAGVPDVIAESPSLWEIAVRSSDAC